MPDGGINTDAMPGPAEGSTCLQMPESEVLDKCGPGADAAFQGVCETPIIAMARQTGNLIADGVLCVEIDSTRQKIDVIGKEFQLDSSGQADSEISFNGIKLSDFGPGTFDPNTGHYFGLRISDRGATDVLAVNGSVTLSDFAGNTTAITGGTADNPTTVRLDEGLAVIDGEASVGRDPRPARPLDGCQQMPGSEVGAVVLIVVLAAREVMRR